MHNPILTISILISGEYNDVKRCLDSIQPLMRLVPSELILTDTGCKSEVRKLIEQYTDQIMEFTWINDFSAARNVGLKVARGEWFMYLDDDEWLEKAEKLAEFFMSEEQRDYDVVLYYQRNYSDMDMSGYMDYAVDRIIRISPELHFENRVHEAYAGIRVRKKKQLNVIAHHLGYVYKNEAEQQAKFMRNGKLLELECKEKPQDMRLWHQYAANYWMVKDWKKSADICYQAIKKPSDSKYWDMLHTDLLYCLAMEEAWEKLIATGQEFVCNNLYPYQKFGVRQFLVKAYFMIGQYDKVCEQVTKVINAYRYYKRDPLQFADGQLGGYIFFNRDNISEMLLYIVVAVIHEERTDLLQLIANKEICNEMAYLERERREELAGYTLQCELVTKHKEYIENHTYIRELLRKTGVYDYIAQLYEINVEEEKTAGDVLLDRLEFEPSFFEPETRNSFSIEPMMKNAWAAQLELLDLIGEICRTYDIKYFVDWGTLLGAVRHHGYIPWDDDADIGMLRGDYIRFREVIEQYEGLTLHDKINTEGWGMHAARVSTKGRISLSRGNLKAHRGFPFPIGVDVFIIDYAPDDEELRKEQKNILMEIAAVYNDRKWLRENEFSSDEYEKHYARYVRGVRMIEEHCSMKFSQTYPTELELLILIEEVSGMYGPEDGRMLTQATCLVAYDNYFISETAYKEMIMMPFENIMVPVPVGYDEILRAKYGENYMVPANIGGGHNYPFYNSYIRELYDKGETEDITEQRIYIEKATSHYYVDFINKTSESAVPTSLDKIPAAMLEVLAEIQRICTKYDIKYYAYGDTLRGAVEYHGFMPGIEDIDLAMQRSDYERFLDLLKTDLGVWFDYSNVYVNERHEDMRCYVMSDSYLVNEQEYEGRFHGCLHMVAVCVTAIDDVPMEPQKRNMSTMYIKELLKTANTMPSLPPYSEDVLHVVQEWRQISDVDINEEADLRREFIRCADMVAMAYKEPETTMVRVSAELQNNMDRIYAKSWFEETVEKPFEEITISIPIGYKYILGEE